MKRIICVCWHSLWIVWKEKSSHCECSLISRAKWPLVTKREKVSTASMLVAGIHPSSLLSNLLVALPQSILFSSDMSPVHPINITASAWNLWFFSLQFLPVHVLNQYLPNTYSLFVEAERIELPHICNTFHQCIMIIFSFCPVQWVHFVFFKSLRSFQGSCELLRSTSTLKYASMIHKINPVDTSKQVYTCSLQCQKLYMVNVAAQYQNLILDVPVPNK